MPPCCSWPAGGLSAWSRRRGATAGLHLTQAEWQVQDRSRASARRRPRWTAGLARRLAAAALPFRPCHRPAAPGAIGPRAGTHARTPGSGGSSGSPFTRGPLALYGARIKTDGTIAVYINGRWCMRRSRRARCGTARARRSGCCWTRPPTAAGAGNPATPGTHAAIQVALSSLWLGPRGLAARYQVRQWLQQELPAMLSAAFLAVGVFACSCGSGAGTTWLPAVLQFGRHAFLRGLHFYVGLPIANDWFAWLTVNSLFWLVVGALLPAPAAWPRAALADALPGHA
jgi:hypothetical protein